MCAAYSSTVPAIWKALIFTGSTFGVLPPATARDGRLLAQRKVEFEIENTRGFTKTAASSVCSEFCLSELFAEFCRPPRFFAN